MPKTILVVEDYPNLRREIVARLRFNGYEVLEAADVPTAQHVFLSSNLHLVVTDCLLIGELDGVDLTRFLRQQGFAGPIVLYTYSPSPLTILEAGAVGVTQTVDKNRGIAYLSQAVEELLLESGKTQNN